MNKQSDTFFLDRWHLLFMWNNDISIIHKKFVLFNRIQFGLIFVLANLHKVPYQFGLFDAIIAWICWFQRKIRNWTGLYINRISYLASNHSFLENVLQLTCVIAFSSKTHWTILLLPPLESRSMSNFSKCCHSNRNWIIFPNATNNFPAKL